MLNHIQIEVLEQLDSELMIAEYPEAAADVVSDLGVFLTLSDEHLLQDVETALIDKVLRQIVDLEQVHKGVSVRLTRQLLNLVFVL